MVRDGALERLEGFASLYGPAFYGLAANPDRLRLVRQEDPISLPDRIETGAGPVAVFDPGFPLYWQVDERTGA